MDNINNLQISAPIAPYNTEDRYPTHIDIYGEGGHRSVDTLNDRDNISKERRKVGMLVYVKEDNNLYILQNGIENENWKSFYDIFKRELKSLRIQEEAPEDPYFGIAWLQTSSGILRYRDETNTQWNPLQISYIDGGEF